MGFEFNQISIKNISRDALFWNNFNPHPFNLFFNPFTSSDPIVRLGLINPDLDDLKYVCCNFVVYHVLKAKNRSGEIQSPTDACNQTDRDNINGGASLRRCWSIFAEAYQAEAGELAVNYRRFSLPQFIDFLANLSPASGCLSQVDSFLIQLIATTDPDWFITSPCLDAQKVMYCVA